MRTPSIEIKKLNLQKVEIQLAVLEQRIDDAKAKVADLESKHDERLALLQSLQAELNGLVASKTEDIQSPFGKQ
jgi:chromosome segregation ATPase